MDKQRLSIPEGKFKETVSRASVEVKYEEIRTLVAKIKEQLQSGALTKSDRQNLKLEISRLSNDEQSCIDKINKTPVAKLPRELVTDKAYCVVDHLPAYPCGPMASSVESVEQDYEQIEVEVVSTATFKSNKFPTTTVVPYMHNSSLLSPSIGYDDFCRELTHDLAFANKVLAAVSKLRKLDPLVTNRHIVEFAIFKLHGTVARTAPNSESTYGSKWLEKSKESENWEGDAIGNATDSAKGYFRVKKNAPYPHSQFEWLLENVSNFSTVTDLSQRKTLTEKESKQLNSYFDRKSKTAIHFLWIIEELVTRGIRDSETAALLLLDAIDSYVELSKSHRRQKKFYLFVYEFAKSWTNVTVRAKEDIAIVDTLMAAHSVVCHTAGSEVISLFEPGELDSGLAAAESDASDLIDALVKCAKRQPNARDRLTAAEEQAWRQRVFGNRPTADPKLVRSAQRKLVRILPIFLQKQSSELRIQQ